MTLIPHPSCRHKLTSLIEIKHRLVHEDSGISAFNPHAFFKDKSKNLIVLEESQLARLGDLVREAFLRTLTLIWRGKSDKDEINSLLDRAALDEAVRKQLFELSDFEQAHQELLQ